MFWDTVASPPEYVDTIRSARKELFLGQDKSSGSPTHSFFRICNMSKSLWLSTLVFAGACMAPGFAQGGDECASATSIMGAGPHAFDQTLATESIDFSGCGTLNFDVWYSWTAGQSVDHLISLCGGATHDTKLAVYDSCGGVELACNDDTCGLQSEVTFNAVSGNTYLIRIGTYNTVPGAIGSFDITPDLPIVNPANGHSYKVVPGNMDWLSAKAAAEGMMLNGTPGHLVTFSDQAEVDFVINNMTVMRPWIGLFQNLNAPNYSEPSNGWEWVTGEPFTFTSWAVGEPNDSSGVEHYAEMFGSGEWNDAVIDHFSTNAFIVEWGSSGGTGVPFCNPNNSNSTGFPAVLAGTTGSGVGSGLHLEITDGVPGQLAYLLAGNEATVGIPVSNGQFCLVGTPTASFFRYNVAGTDMDSIGGFDASGTWINVMGTSTTGFGFDVPSTIPDSVPIPIVAGDTWHFQAWYRDTPAGSGTSNFTNGLSVTF
ncbi:MAG: hypothetical protein ACI87O_002007 [Planctomycetota bacterium]|jgi:hypothetical protein